MHAGQDVPKLNDRPPRKEIVACLDLGLLQKPILVRS